VPDIYLSYEREDRDRARLVELALRELGWSVFTKEDIRGGQSFSEVIKKEIGRASCVLVLWSGKSITDSYAISDATRGDSLGKLVGVRIDDVAVPVGFRKLPAADLVGWDGSDSAPQFKELVQGIQALAGLKPRSPDDTQSSGLKPRSPDETQSSHALPRLPPQAAPRRPLQAAPTGVLGRLTGAIRSVIAKSRGALR
jgi:hypothetical protein